MKIIKFATLLGAALACPVQAQDTASIIWSCAFTSPDGGTFDLNGVVTSLPLAGTSPLIGTGSIHDDPTGHFIGDYDVWMGEKQFDLMLYGTERDGYKPSLSLRIPRKKYADQGAGIAMVTTLNDPNHDGVSFSDFVGVGFCTSEWTDINQPEIVQ